MKHIFNQILIRQYDNIKYPVVKVIKKASKKDFRFRINA